MKVVLKSWITGGWGGYDERRGSFIAKLGHCRMVHPMIEGSDWLKNTPYMASALKEVLGPHNGLLFKEEALSPVFCKPKLIPLKSVTLEKLEQMQRDSMTKMLELEQKLKEDAKVVGVLLIALV
uniref:Uncharacterized protein n=2 Tax=Parascaris univalens TaxID=6257 RepID=A0A915AC01_PARUN